MKKKFVILPIVSVFLLVGIIYLFSSNTKETYAAGTNFADYIISKATTAACNEGGSGVCYTNNHEYRYIGANVDNYVSFNNDMYRIIGVFDDYTHRQTGENLVKLIRSRPIGGFSWGVYNKADANGELNTYGGYANDWTGENGTATSKANLNILLNEYFYNKTNTSATYGACGNWTYFYYGNSNYKTFDCSDIVGYGIDSNLQNYIEEVTWHIRGYSSNSLTKQNFYLCERGDYSGCTGANGSTTNVETTGKIGLMYVSDYLYATSYKSSTDTSITGSSSYNGNKNWLFKGYEWTMTPGSKNATVSFYVDLYGRVFSNLSYVGVATRPTFYLKSSVYWTGEGDGTFGNPYKVACDDC